MESEYRRTVAKDLLRHLLEQARREEERERATGERLRTLIRAGRKMANLGPAQLAEASGLSRPGIYEIQDRRAQGPVEGLEEILLAAIGAAGATTRTALVQALGLPEIQVSRAIERLAAGGSISFARAGYDEETNTEILLLSSSGEQSLDIHLRRARSSAPELWTAYLAVDETEALGLAEEAKSRLGPHRTALLPAGTRNDMTTPEIALSFDVPDAVALFNEAGRVWHDLRQVIGLDPSAPRIAAVVAPSIRSSVLESFGRSAAQAAPKAEAEIMQAVVNATAEVDERTLCVRALTEAAWALRRSVEQGKRPPDLDNGEAAFAEWQTVAVLELDKPRERIQQSLVQALERATDRLGPLPARRLGRVRDPGAAPTVVEGVEPTHADLIAIARSAGEAVGFAQVATDGKIDAAETVRKMTTPRSSP